MNTKQFNELIRALNALAHDVAEIKAHLTGKPAEPEVLLPAPDVDALREKINSLRSPHTDAPKKRTRRS